jgi:hypothetical protein
VLARAGASETNSGLRSAGREEFPLISALVRISLPQRSIVQGGRMKLYRIVRRDGVWHATGGDQEHALAASEDRESLIDVARKVAARQSDAEVLVFDEADRLDVVYVYSGGAESIRFPAPPRLRVVRNE